MNPFMMGLMQMMAAQSPEMFGQSMASLGVSPEVFAASQQFPSPDPLGASIMGAQQPAAATTPAQPAAGGAMPMKSGMQGVTATPPKPYMHAGVFGSQPAPTMQVNQNQGVLAAEIMKLIGGANRQNPLRVPGLGSLIRGGTYG